MRVFLVGLPGAGKSSWGNMLAAALALPFSDLDELIRRRYGMEAGRMIETCGEAAFRLRESAELLRWIDRNPTGVLATGGGTPIHRAGMALMNAYGFTVWLELGREAWLGRLESLVDRPLLRDGFGRVDAERANLVFDRRQPVYRQARWRIAAAAPPFSADQVQHAADEVKQKADQAADQRAIDADVLQVLADLEF